MRIHLWEYKIFELPKDAGQSQVHTLLNKFGDEGWELVTVREKTIVKLDTTVTRTLFILKRPKGYKDL